MTPTTIERVFDVRVERAPTGAERAEMVRQAAPMLAEILRWWEGPAYAAGLPKVERIRVEHARGQHGQVQG